MKTTFSNTPACTDYTHAQTTYAALAVGRDFTTPDGCIVPRELGEAALRQRTALLIGGMLIGNWPEQL